MTWKIFKTVALFMLGAIVGMWMAYTSPVDPTPEQCLSVCVSEFERMGC